MQRAVHHRPEDHGHAVVEQRLAADDHGERVWRAELLEKGYHGDGVGSGHHRTKGHAQIPGPVPSARDDILDDDGEEGRSDGDAREGERGALAHAVFEDVEVEVHRVAEDQRGDEGVEQQVAVHGFPDLEAARKVLVGARGLGGNPCEQTDDQDERSVRDGWTPMFMDFLQDLLRQNADEDGENHEHKHHGDARLSFERSDFIAIIGERIIKTRNNGKQPKAMSRKRPTNTVRCPARPRTNLLRVK